ncbi:hypothetical protein BGZ67_006456 [Mortierella alpina]|nr:hypothetical protein BGZ67_006456 [Mortierella alpina]
MRAATPGAEDQSQQELGAEDQPQQDPEGQQQAAEVHPVKAVNHNRVAINAVMDLYRIIGHTGTAAVLPNPPCTVKSVFCTMVSEITSELGQFYTRLEFELPLKVNGFLRRQGKEEREEHSEQSDKISLWFRRNLMLPKVERWKFYPQSGHQEGYVTFSELGLLEVLWAQGGVTTPLMKMFFGQRDDMHDLSFHLFVHHTNHPRRTTPLHEYMRLRYDRSAWIRETRGRSTEFPSISEYESCIPDRQTSEPEDVVNPRVQRKQWANRQAKRADYEQVLNVVLRTIGTRTGDGERSPGLDVVVVLGDGQFEGVRGRASFHEKVAEFLFQR